MVEKIINHVRPTVSPSIKARETPAGKSSLHKVKSSLGRKFICNYRSLVGMSIYIYGSKQPEKSMDVHQYTCFCNNPRLVHEPAVRRITKYLASTSIHVNLPDVN